MDSQDERILLRVLLLEDNPDDAYLIERVLEKAGYAPCLTVVEEKAAFLEALDQQPDLIISDNALPSFNALQALEYLRHTGLDIPFIIVSGTISEEAAVRAMREGAADYVLKDRMARLGQAVRRAMLERQHRKEKEQALQGMRRSSQLNKGVLASLTAHIAVLDQAGLIIMVNEAWEQFALANGALPYEGTGVSVNYLDICRHAKAQGDLLASEALEGIESVLQGRRAHFSLEYPCHSLTAERWFVMQVTPLSAEPGGAVVAHENITARRQAELQVQRSRERYRLLARHATDLISKHTLDGTFLYASPACKALLDYEPEELVGCNIFDFFHPEDRAALCNAHEATTELPLVTTHAFRIRRKDGEYIWFESTNKVIQDPTNGGATEILSVSRDISERKAAELSLRESQKRWRRLVESHPVPLLIVEGAHIIYANPSSAPVLGAANHQDLLGASVYRFLPEREQSTLATRLHRIQGGKVLPPWQVEIVGLDGRQRHIQVFAVGTVYKGRQVLQVILLDVTDHHAYEQALISAKVKAEEMSQLKSIFLANMSHEIRTPLTGIIGFAEIMSDYASDDVQEMAHHIYKSGQRLYETLNSVLDLAQLESQPIDAKLVPCDLGQLVDEVVGLLAGSIRDSGLNVAVRKPEDAPVLVLGNQDAIHRILTNLLSNALKFTAHGHIEVLLEAETDIVRLHVTDSGVGIAPAFLPYVFDEFKQESSGTARHFEGNGIGLTITKKLVDLLGGTITVQSVKGKGSTFTVQFARLHDLPAFSPEPAAPSPLTSACLLFVPDNRYSQVLVRTILKEHCQLDIAASAAEAISLLSEKCYNLVLLEANHGGEGMELLSALRAHATLQDVPLVVLTAGTLPDGSEGLHPAGFRGCVAKPFGKQQLLGALHAALTT